jgi:GTP-binding protein YchF
MKDVGIVGLPYSGKSTLFNALTRAGAAGGRANQAVVDVPDERLAVLARLEGSERVVHAKVRFVDVPGGLTAQGVAGFRQTDALALIVRAFGDDVEPAAELSALKAELILADLASVEPALEKARKRARSEAGAKAEADALAKVHDALEAEAPARAAGLDAAEEKLVRGFGLLTLKPWVVIANVAEDLIGTAPEGLGLPQDALTVCAALEAEVAGLDDDEARALLAGFGVTERGLDRVIAAGYRALGLITFLTTGPDESRAWEVRAGAKAPEAAGQIHSDLERGFIRAEVVSYDDLVAAGGWDEAKAAGKLRIEGKDYLVQEGDVMNIRFAV